jgi:hypothetical protein
MNAAAQTSDVSTFRSETLAAFNILGSHAVDIPAFSPSIRVASLRSVAGVVNSVGMSYPNFFTMLNARMSTTYTPFNPIYQFGGGDPSTLRWGQASGTQQLNIFNAQTQWESNAIGEVYDTLFRASPVQIGNFICWMCNTYTPSVDSRGNEHFLIELKQTLRWQDGTPLDAFDVKFSLLNLRDHAYIGGIYLSGILQSVTIVSPSTLDIVMTGQSISNLYFISTASMIPRHLWELAGDTTYTDVGQVDPAKLDHNYDPIASGTFIGSGPSMCRSTFSEDYGRVGTGCVRNADGSRGGQTIGAGATMTLQAFDRTNDPGNNDPFLQYTRSFNPSWGTGSGTAAFSGQFQEFSWADQNNDAQVTVTDLASVADCFGATAPTTSCPSSAYNYWLRSSFHPDTSNTIGIEVTVVASHLDDTWIYPFTWSSGPKPLQNIVPFTP